MLPFAINVYERGAAGVPTTALIDNLSRACDSLEWTITDQFGFESCTVSFIGTPALAQIWFGRLGCGVAVFGPGGERCWEGRITGVDAQLGDETHSRSLEGMANRWDVTYSTVNGVPGSTGTASNTASIAVYGTKDEMAGLNTAISTEATNLRTQLLAANAWPVRQPSSQVNLTTAPGQQQITIRCTGWYGTLGDVLTSRTDTTTEATTTQVAALIGTASPGIGATNPFLSTSTARITGSGINATRKIESNTTYRTKIEALLSQGNGTNRFAWGVYEGRQFVVEVWAGATPGTIHYIRWLGSGLITTTMGGMIHPWSVRPNRMYQVAELSDTAMRSAERDAGGRMYVARITFRADRSGMGVSLEPSDSNDLSARLAYFGAR